MEHDWQPSTLGHGETMCRHCFATNREAAVLGLTECDAPPPAPANEQKTVPLDFEDYDDYDDDCGQCGGEGYTYDCIDGCCVNAEEGCRLCEQRCDFCNPFKPTPKQAEERAKLAEILSDAVAKQKSKASR